MKVDNNHLEILYITNIPKNINEGGVARNVAFYKYFTSKKSKIINLNYTSVLVRILKSLQLIYIMLFFREKKIFIHLGVILVLLPPVFFIKYFNSFFNFIINRFAKKNELFIEVNDLYFEQSIDLELGSDSCIKDFQKIIFRLDTPKFLFASSTMKEYVESSYHNTSNDKFVLLNGTPSLKKMSLSPYHEQFLSSKTNKAIYAGTLNRGRGIKKLIDIFANAEKWNLILIGSGGKWLQEEVLPNNIFYLGEFEEDYAHNIVSRCDLGILPYEDKFYYNLCYPTKIPFYLSANIPVLSQRLKELERYNYSNIFFVSMNEWSVFLNSREGKLIGSKSGDTSIFHWESILSDLDMILK